MCVAPLSVTTRYEVLSAARAREEGGDREAATEPRLKRIRKEA